MNRFDKDAPAGTTVKDYEGLWQKTQTGEWVKIEEHIPTSEAERLVPRSEEPNPLESYVRPVEPIVSSGAPDPRMSLTVSDMVLPKSESLSPSGIKYDEGKLEYHLVPPECLAELVKVLMFGKKKYAEDNWKKGFDFTRLHNSVLRHMEAVRMAEARDPETHFSHYAHAMCGVMFLLWYALQDEKHGKAQAPKSP